jgi:glutamyl-tRNA synthetase
VVRGDDHISNTPKQILLYRAIGASEPVFAHVPLILGADRKRLSKRHGATSVMEYARRGYPPEAMVNFLSLLGWSPGTDQEVFSRDELIAAFDLRGISGGNAVFNQDKLDWFSQQHLLRMPPDDLARRLKPWFEAEGLWDDAYLGERRGWFLAVLDLLRPRVKTLAEFPGVGRYFFTQAVERFDEAAVGKHLRVDGMAEHLAATGRALGGLDTFDTGSVEAAVRGTADARGVKAASLIHGVRVAVTGRAASPGLFDVLILLGRERVRARLHAAVSIAASRSA